MKTLSIINLKGGVGKTVSAINISHILVEEHGKKVLLIDGDKQGNTSKFFGAHDYEISTLADVLTQKGYRIEDAIQPTAYEGLDVLPANMLLLKADREILMDCTRPQQTRLKKALAQVAADYDYCVIDCAPDLGMSVINALVACDDVMIPIKVDNFAFDGVAQILEQIEDLREFNPTLRVMGGFVTMHQRNNANISGVEYLQGWDGLPMFQTMIRKTVSVDETTFSGLPLLKHAKNSTAAKDYIDLVAEYLSK